MLIGEPPSTQADLHFSLFGIPIRVHPFFWLIALLLGPLRDGVREMLVWIVAFFLGILVHELGHAWTMRAYGFRPWITLYGLGGMASYNQAYTQGSRGGGALRQILISAAGPASGFLLALAVIGLVLATGHKIRVDFGLPFGIFVSVQEILFNNLHVTRFVSFLLFITVVYGVLNLMPIYPLDGGHISREIFLAISPGGGIRHSLILSMLTGIGLAVMAVTGQAWFAVFLFGYLAYSSFATLQAYSGHGR